MQSIIIIIILSHIYLKKEVYDRWLKGVAF